MRDLIDVGSGVQQDFDALQAVLARREHHWSDAAAIGVARASESEIRGGRIGGSHQVFFGAVASLRLLTLPALLGLLALSSVEAAAEPAFPLPQAAGCLIRRCSLPDRGSQI